MGSSGSLVQQDRLGANSSQSGVSAVAPPVVAAVTLGSLLINVSVSISLMRELGWMFYRNLFSMK